MSIRSTWLTAAAALASGVAGTVWPTVASAAKGQPEPWQVWTQDAASPVMERIASLNDFITWIIVGIVLLVMFLLGYVILRFNARRNPVPAKFSHNQMLEFAWTAVPIVILVIIAIPSFQLLYYMDKTQEADMTIKVVGHQWYWSYEYPDHGNFMFDSFMKYPEDLEPDEPRLLAVDNEVVLPVDTNVRILLTSTDVIHAWAVPSLGVKTDTVPGRVNETWVRIEEPGMYYGQCSELCGVNHGFMPIAVRAVSKEEFQAWVTEAQEMYAKAPGAEPTVKTATADDAADSEEDAVTRLAQAAPAVGGASQ